MPPAWALCKPPTQTPGAPAGRTPSSQCLGRCWILPHRASGPPTPVTSTPRNPRPGQASEAHLPLLPLTLRAPSRPTPPTGLSPRPPWGPSLRPGGPRGDRERQRAESLGRSPGSEKCELAAELFRLPTGVSSYLTGGIPRAGSLTSPGRAADRSAQEMLSEVFKGPTESP